METDRESHGRQGPMQSHRLPHQHMSVDFESIEDGVSTSESVVEKAPAGKVLDPAESHRASNSGTSIIRSGHSSDFPHKVAQLGESAPKGQFSLVQYPLFCPFEHRVIWLTDIIPRLTHINVWDHAYT